MTTEEKAKAYDEALERMKSWARGEHPECFTEAQKAAEFIFPELKEGEDEKVKKALIEYFNEQCDMSDWNGVYGYQVVAWLEKQGERKDNNKLVWKHWSGCGVAGNGDGTQIYLIKQYNTYSVCSCLSFECDYILLSDLDKLLSQKFEMKSAEESLGISSEEYNDIANECLYGESKTVDKVKPKFKNGQWIVWQDKCYKVNYNGCGYELIDQNGLSTSLEYGTVDTSARLWNTTKDAKDGDVLASDNSIFIFQEEYIAEKPIAYCGLMNERFLVGGEDACWTNERYYPATKEQRDTLLKAMADAGYEWDSEKKELNKIEADELTKFEEALFTAFSDGWQQYLHGKEVNVAQWAKEHSIELLKVARQNFTTWSEEDECYMSECIGAIATKDGWSFEEKRKTKHWLKSLKQRIGWKPSEEQIQCLYDAIEHYQTNGYPASKLNELYEQMSKIYKL